MSTNSSISTHNFSTPVSSSINNSNKNSGPWYSLDGCFDPWDGQHDTLNYKHITLTLIYILISFACFRVLQFTVRWYLFGKTSFPTFSFFEFARRFRRRHHQRPPPPSQSLKIVPPNKKWRISNEAVSLLHSVVSGLWALYAIMIYTQLVTISSVYDSKTGKWIEGMRYFCHSMPQALIFMSFGYMVHDFVDLVINERSMRIIELIFHHVIVIAAFCTTLVTRQFLGVVVLGLLMELNSIFLHSRSLLNLYRQPKESISFRFIALVNLVTYIVFRMAVSIYLLYWLFWSIFAADEHDRLTWGYIPITFIVIVSLTVTNSVLLYRVMAADGLLGKKRTRSETSEPKSDDELGEEEMDLEQEDEGSDVEAGEPHVSFGHQRTESTQTGDDTVLTEAASININTNSTQPSQQQPFIQSNSSNHSDIPTPRTPPISQQHSIGVDRTPPTNSISVSGQPLI